MSHEITSTDGMFTVRQAAWHDLGVVFEEYPDRATAQAIAHPWEPLREDIFRNVKQHIVIEGVQFPLVTTPDGLQVALRDEFLAEDGNTLREGYSWVTKQVKLDGWYANQRSDNGDVLGVVTDNYRTVLNSELWDIAEALEQGGDDVMYETGGSLRGGSQVWVLVRLKDPLVVPGDPRGETIPYFALQNSHDGSGSFRGQATMTRIVCANTSHVADMDARARGTEFMFRHTKNVGDRISQAQQALSGWRQSLEDWMIQQEALVKTPVTDAGETQFLEKFIPMPPTHLITERVQANVEEERQKWLGSYRSVTGEGIENTAYGLVAASTEYAEWHRKAHNAESRFRRTFLSRDRIISTAVELALDAAKVDA
jgi:phage/plasmid-like protein (TIGR03299 family)